MTPDEQIKTSREGWKRALRAMSRSLPLLKMMRGMRACESMKGQIQAAIDLTDEATDYAEEHFRPDVVLAADEKGEQCSKG